MGVHLFCVTCREQTQASVVVDVDEFGSQRLVLPEEWRCVEGKWSTGEAAEFYAHNETCATSVLLEEHRAGMGRPTLAAYCDGRHEAKVPLSWNHEARGDRMVSTLRLPEGEWSAIVVRRHRGDRAQPEASRVLFACSEGCRRGLVPTSGS